MEGIDLNQEMKTCLDLHGYDRNLPVEERFIGFDFRSAARCSLDKRTSMYIKENKATAEFLKLNPHFRYPGGSNGNISPCWGETKKYHIEGGC